MAAPGASALHGPPLEPGALPGPVLRRGRVAAFHEVEDAVCEAAVPTEAEAVARVHDQALRLGVISSVDAAAGAIDAQADEVTELAVVGVFRSEVLLLRIRRPNG